AAVPLAFGKREAVPEGTEVVWDFGDGTQVTGMQVTHAFSRAGAYTIVETIRDKDGPTRTARTHAAAAPPTVPMARPRRVRAALRGGGGFGAGPVQLSDAKPPDGTAVVLGQSPAGDKVAVVQRYGYLYIRAAGGSDPLIALRTAGALPPDKGLAVDPGFVNA